MYELAKLTRHQSFQCAVKLRNLDKCAASMEDLANQIVRFLYESLTDGGKPACVLVRFFKTHSYGKLNEELQNAAREILKGSPIDSETKCLTLLATAGDLPQWNDRQMSSAHKAIPLIDEDFVSKAPMISQLIKQFGLDIKSIIHPVPEILAYKNEYKRIPSIFNVFYVPNALTSPYIPAQENFVVPYGIKSVFGFGGMLPSGNVFAIILFTKIFIPIEIAYLFKWVAAYVRVAAATFDKVGCIFNDDVYLLN
ncbi:hypothetical protein CEN40_16885 [Fischerella thermalis CCMEE 5205]|nr:hypothetical protein CEN40_16885 [Fischerella thermalis CCMEE 5205]